MKNNKQEKTTILNDLDNIINRLRKSSDGIQSTEKELNKLNDIRVELDDFEKNGGIEALFQELRDEIKKLDDKANRHKTDPKYIESLEKEYIELNKLAITLKQYQRVVHKLPEKENRCKTSKIKLQENIIANSKLSETLENDQFAEEERKEVLIISGQIKEVNDKLEEEITLRKELTRLKAKEIRNIFKTIENEEKRRIEIKSKYEVKNERIRTENDRRAHITKTLQNEKFENFQEKQTENKKKSENAEETYDNTRTVKINASRDLDEHDRLIEDQLKLAKTISSREEKIKKIKETQDLLAELGKIFKQIGGRILSRLRNNINLETVEILELLANPQLQGITLENDYSLSIQTPEGDERPGFFSGGQRVRIGLAFRLALSQVLANFRGNELDTLIIDEGGFGALDEDGQKGVVDVFSAIQDRFQRMLIISHIDAIAENLPGTLIHIKDGSIVI